ncbi:GDYXXLXY domain-containing protein [Nostoc sp. CCY0012]|uniref:GDYXXLXY domain-containing protein n=1 Tax=Nostoc sp. CCY0012 TaxID=1056123 RepID=UPI0039C65419
MTTSPSPTPEKPLLWRFVIPLLIQAGFILAVPAQAVYTLMTGRTAVLQTVPVDPYDLLRGYSVILNYEISLTSNLKELPGWTELVKQHPSSDQQFELESGTNLYVILEEQKSTGEVPQAWKPVRVSGELPSSLNDNQIALKGISSYNSISYGLETYYIPEDQRNDINNDISTARPLKPGQPQPIVVEVKVNPQGNAVPLTMWVRDRRYNF